MSQENILAEGLQQLGLSLDTQTQQTLLKYVELLHKWNRVHNLTAVRDPLKMVTYHLLDSLVVVPHIAAARLVDVGSGGGMPGIPLAVALPQLEVTLLDSNQKKTGFLRQAVIDLGLSNVTVVCDRAELYQPEALFDVVISRAFSELAEFVRMTRHLLVPGGMMLAMKGVYPEEEIAALPADITVQRVISLDVPGLGAARHLVEMRMK